MEQQPNEESLGGAGTAATTNTAAPATTTVAPVATTGTHSAEMQVETSTCPSLYDRIAALEHQVSVLTANLHTESTSWFTHLRTLIDAGIHRVESFFGTLVHSKVTKDAAEPAAGEPASTDSTKAS